MEPIEVSRIHQTYLRSIKRTSNMVRLTQFCLLAAFLCLWEWAGQTGKINVLLFSYPSKILNLFLQKLIDHSLLPHIGTTVFETIVSFMLGTLLGTMIATLIWWSPFLSRVLEPYLVIANSMPKVALGPLFIVGLGPGYLSIIGMGVAISVIITTIVIYTSFKEVNRNFIKVVQTFGANKQQTFMKVILPSTLPTIVSTVKVNVGLSWVGVIVGEFLVSQMGLGYLIIYGFQVFNFTLVMVSLFIIAIVATMMYQIVAYIERKLID